MASLKEFVFFCIDAVNLTECVIVVKLLFISYYQFYMPFLIIL